MRIPINTYRGDDRFDKWDEDYKKVYPHIVSDTVIAYATAIREYGALIEFCPLMYLENEEYRKKMDENAQALLEALDNSMKARGEGFQEQCEAILTFARLTRSIWGRYVMGEGYIDDDDDDNERIRERTQAKETDELSL